MEPANQSGSTCSSYVAGVVGARAHVPSAFPLVFKYLPRFVWHNRLALHCFIDQKGIFCAGRSHCFFFDRASGSSSVCSFDDALRVSGRGSRQDAFEAKGHVQSRLQVIGSGFQQQNLFEDVMLTSAGCSAVVTSQTATFIAVEI